MCSSATSNNRSSGRRTRAASAVPKTMTTVVAGCWPRGRSGVERASIVACACLIASASQRDAYTHTHTYTTARSHTLEFAHIPHRHTNAHRHMQPTSGCVPFVIGPPSLLSSVRTPLGIYHRFPAAKAPIRTAPLSEESHPSSLSLVSPHPPMSSPARFPCTPLSLSLP
jgi:hypothetical protein